jgi:CubicO group peptidase (beta-lactamase class C family)
LEEYIDDNLYQPLRIQSTGYLPLERWPAERIAPTEYDLKFRKQLIQGHVHDPGAAMVGGVGGHAGIFSTAGDLGRIMQMLIDDGRYAGQQILTTETIDYYTDCHYCSEDNRRGIGFDKPTSALNKGPSSNGASAESFGHSGFTGTLAWADPTHDIVYVFLSNRVYPNAENKKLLNMDIRTRIQQVIYDAFEIPDRLDPASAAKN